MSLSGRLQPFYQRRKIQLSAGDDRDIHITASFITVEKLDAIAGQVTIRFNSSDADELNVQVGDVLEYPISKMYVKSTIDVELVFWYGNDFRYFMGVNSAVLMGSRSYNKEEVKYDGSGGADYTEYEYFGNFLYIGEIQICGTDYQNKATCFPKIALYYDGSWTSFYIYQGLKLKMPFEKIKMFGLTDISSSYVDWYMSIIYGTDIDLSYERHDVTNQIICCEQTINTTPTEFHVVNTGLSSLSWVASGKHFVEITFYNAGSQEIQVLPYDQSDFDTQIAYPFLKSGNERTEKWTMFCLYNTRFQTGSGTSTLQGMFRL